MPRLPGAARGVELLPELRLRLHSDERIAVAARHLTTRGARRGDADRRRFGREIPQACVLGLEVLATERHGLAIEEPAHDLERLREHLMTDVHGGHDVPVTCSLRCSPAPTPSVKRPSESNCTVAAFCATTAGWYRIVGHVT